MSPDTRDAVAGDWRRQGVATVEVLYGAAPGFRLIQASLWVVLHRVSIKPFPDRQTDRQI